MMNIRKAQGSDLPRILEIYEAARGIMRRSGNPTQWFGGYPSEQLLAEDIAKGELYVICDEAQASRPLGDQASQPLSDQASQPLSDQASRPLGDQAPQPLSDQASQSLGTPALRPLGDQASQPLSTQASQPLDCQTPQIHGVFALIPGEDPTYSVIDPLEKLWPSANIESACFEQSKPSGTSTTEQSKSLETSGPEQLAPKTTGAWLNDEPYFAIHRIGSDGTCPGILKAAIAYAESIGAANIRIDTHMDNKIMQHLLAKYGFTLCGIIYIVDNSPRLAYHKVIASNR